MGRLHPNLQIFADDFGLYPGVSDTILDVAERGLIDAVSVVTVSDDQRQRLFAIREAGVKIGMHWMPVGPAPAPWPSLPRFLFDLFTKQTDSILRAHFDRQVQSFVARLQFQPDFVDSHMHVHQLPRVRSIFEVGLREHGLRCLRSTAHVRSVESGVQAWIKKQVLGLFGRGFGAKKPPIWLTLSYETLNAAETARAIARSTLTTPTQMIVHPGLAEDLGLRGRDPLWRARDKDVALLEALARELGR